MRVPLSDPSGGATAAMTATQEKEKETGRFAPMIGAAAAGATEFDAMAHETPSNGTTLAPILSQC